jgi:hypothetical protein
MIQKVNNEILYDAYDLELKEHDIIPRTYIATSTSVLSELKKFKQLIIDEAGMTKEPEALVPILLCQPEKVVLIGNHAQLRPIIKCQYARDLGLDQSIFERYWFKVTMLEEQYRMHDSICYYPSKAFYEGQLKTKTQNYSSAVYWPGRYLTDSKDELFLLMSKDELFLLMSKDELFLLMSKDELFLLMSKATSQNWLFIQMKDLRIQCVMMRKLTVLRKFINI